MVRDSAKLTEQEQGLNGHLNMLNVFDEINSTWTGQCVKAALLWT